MGFFIVAIMLAGLLFFGSKFLGFASRQQRWNQVYNRISLRFGGSGTNRTGAVIHAVAFNYPSLSFDYGRTYCTLSNRRCRQFATGRATELSLTWDQPKFKLEISTGPSESSRLGWKLGGLKRVECGEPTFQATYNVASNQPLVAAQMLAPHVCWQIECLRQMYNTPELRISIRSGTLRISKPGFIKHEQPLEDFLRGGLELFDQLMLLRTAGISFVNDEQATIIDKVCCPICSEQILQDVVLCARCKTPHCHDCWQYNGQCATFACQETRSRALSNG